MHLEFGGGVDEYFTYGKKISELNFTKENSERFYTRRVMDQVTAACAKHATITTVWRQEVISGGVVLCRDPTTGEVTSEEALPTKNHNAVAAKFRECKKSGLTNPECGEVPRTQSTMFEKANMVGSEFSNMLTRQLHETMEKQGRAKPKYWHDENFFREPVGNPAGGLLNCLVNLCNSARDVDRQEKDHEEKKLSNEDKETVKARLVD